ncbi:hypothetical protein [Wolbachia endosymbiont (group A) of Volucella inflata]|uniref:hypothetical protein n=1 Tax=Wolbachia endosymbiont (group A) of Volucella inflata TaxID=2954065 RepID=UPI0022274F50|nr:hypothetical protein [Wolbachia endosymbiont (group A) of Volucella inflata]
MLRRLECERQASSCIDEISSQAELHIGKGDDEDYFNCEKPLGDFWSFFEPLFNLFEVNVDDPKIYQMLKEKKEKNWLLSIIKFMRDKLKELIKKIFARDLSFNQRLDKEIKELQEKLGSGELSEEEFARALERLTALQDLKLRLQMAVVGWIVTMFAEMFGVELAAAVEASTEKEDKKAEKTSLKEEAIKEVHKDIEIKVDEREKPKVPVFLFDVSPGFVRPVPLSKPDLDLLSNSLKDRVPFVQTHDRGKEDIENLPKQEVNKEDKKAKPEEPKKEVCPQKTVEEKPVASGIKFDFGTARHVSFEKRDTNTSVNGRRTTSTNKCGTTNDFNEKELKPTNEQKFDGKESKSTDEHKTNDPFAKLREKVAQRKEFADNEKSSAGQHSVASDAKENPKSKFTDVLEEPAARGNGNTPLR